MTIAFREKTHKFIGFSLMVCCVGFVYLGSLSIPAKGFNIENCPPTKIVR